MEAKVKRWSESSLWSTWNRQRLNAVMRQVALCEIRVGIYKKDEKLYEDNFTWVGISGNPSLDYYSRKGVYKTDYHSVSGDYFKIGMYLDDFKFDLEFACEGDEFVYKVLPRTLSEKYDIYVGFLIGSQKDNFNGGNIELTADGCIFHCKEGKFKVEVDGERSSEALKAPYPGRLFKCSSNIYVSCSSVMSHGELDKFMENKRRAYLNSRVYGEGFLGNGAVESAIKALTWNKVYDNVHETFKSDVTRLWAPASSYYTFYWDNFFTSLIYGLEDEQMAYNQVDSVCSEYNGSYIPQCAFEWGGSGMINPPVGSFCLLKPYNQFGNKALLEEYFDRLFNTNSYLLENKSFDKDGVIQLRSNESLDDTSILNNSLATGLDNSPMYDNAKNENLNDIGMSSIYALDCRMLAEIAAILGRNAEKAILEKRFETARRAINDKMWNEKEGIYCNTTIEGRYCGVYSPTSFYPMAAGIATAERAGRLVQEHLLNEEEFWGQYVIPSISKKHPSYHEQEYWRGCAWPPMNLLVYEGLKRYDFYDTAHVLARKSLDMYMQNWTDFGWVLENFNTKTGGISKNCVPMYTWGGLMVYMAVEEVFEADPQKGLRFGNLSGDYAAVRNLRVGRDLYDVISGDSIKVYRNGKMVLETDVPAIIKNFIVEKDTCSLEVLSEKAGKCTLYLDVAKVNAKTDAICIQSLRYN